MHILEKRIRQAGEAGRQALVPFVTAGFPTPDRFEAILDDLDANGADIIEIGVPFSDPVADGPVVEAASVRALADGISLARILALLNERAAAGRRLRAGLVLMGYVMLSQVTPLHPYPVNETVVFKHIRTVSMG